MRESSPQTLRSILDIPDAGAGLERLTLRVEERGLVMPDGVSREAGLILPPPKEIITNVEGAAPQGLRRDENLEPLDISGSVLAVAKPNFVLSRIVDEAVKDPEVSAILKQNLADDAKDPGKPQAGYLALLESQLLYEPEHRLFEQGTKEYRYREGGEEKHLSVKTDAPLSAALDSFLRAVIEKEPTERSALLRPCLQAIEQVVRGLRDEVKGQETVGYLGGLSKSLVGLLETVDPASRAVILRTVSLMDFSPAVAEELMWHLDRAESLDTPLAMRSYAVLLGEVGTESAFVREQERRIGDLVRRIEELSPQERYDEFVILSQESKRIVMCPPSEFGRKLGLEVEWQPQANRRFLPPEWEGYEDADNLEIIRSSKSLEYTPQYISDVVLLESWMQTHALGVSSLHLHTDRTESSAAPKLSALIGNSNGGAVVDNNLGTWEIRGLMPPLSISEDSRALISGVGIVHAANLLLEGSVSESRDMHNESTRIKGAVHSIRHLVWGMGIDGTFNPRELVQLLKCLAHQEMFAAVNAVSIATKFDLDDPATLDSLRHFFSSWEGYAIYGPSIFAEVVSSKAHIERLKKQSLDLDTLKWLGKEGGSFASLHSDYFRAALQDGRKEYRLAACQVLAKFPELIEPLRELFAECLKDTDPEVRKSACFTVAGSKDLVRALGTELITVYTTDSPDVNFSAWIALRQSPQVIEENAPGLAALLRQEDPVKAQRACQLDELSSRAVTEHSDAIAPLLLHNDSNLRRAAIHALKKSHEAVVKHGNLLLVLRSIPSREIQVSVQGVLLTYPELLEREGAHEMIANQLKSKSPEQLIYAAQLISKSPQVIRQHAEQLFKLLRHSKAEVKIAVLTAFQACPELINGRGAEIVNLIHYPDIEVQDAAYKVLREAPEEISNHLNTIVKLLSHSSDTVRLNSAKTLYSLPDSEARFSRDLHKLFADQSMFVRRVACRTAGKNEASVRMNQDALLSLLTDPDRMVSEAAVEALALIPEIVEEHRFKFLMLLAKGGGVSKKAQAALAVVKTTAGFLEELAVVFDMIDSENQQQGILRLLEGHPALKAKLRLSPRAKDKDYLYTLKVRD